MWGQKRNDEYTKPFPSLRRDVFVTRWRNRVLPGATTLPAPNSIAPATLGRDRFRAAECIIRAMPRLSIPMDVVHPFRWQGVQFFGDTGIGGRLGLEADCRTEQSLAVAPSPTGLLQSWRVQGFRFLRMENWPQPETGLGLECILAVFRHRRQRARNRKSVSRDVATVMVNSRLVVTEIPPHKGARH
jgi:hypothetical protein